MNQEYRVCNRCVMDTTAPKINFDQNGFCNYCSEFLERASGILFEDPEIRLKKLGEIVSRIKERGKGQRYDCIVGVSGGVDSSWVLFKAVELGLRPLAVHMDNGWNSELAQSNIANLIRKLDVDLYTHVINWVEYRRLMQAFFDADVVDVELLYDNAMIAVNYQQALQHKAGFILAGTNQATEGMRGPSWNWFKYDAKNIRSIARMFGDVELNTFPSLGTLGLIYCEFVRNARWTPILNFMEYKKDEAIEVLQREFLFKPYPYKHYESIFTRFYQGYILPEKFGIDKRRLHFSNLIISGQMMRQDALKMLQESPYPSQDALEKDKIYFLKKMDWSLTELENYIKRPEKLHDAYPSEKRLWDFSLRVYKAIKGSTERPSPLKSI